MNVKKIISELASQDLKEIGLWYNEKVNGLGKRFTKEVRAKINFLIKHPLSCEIRYNEVRIALLKDFPYTIHYYYDSTDNILLVLGVYHTSRNPTIWEDRK